jgi:cyclophilin family peptidyl-prolyl cis-trans isomerase
MMRQFAALVLLTGAALADPSPAPRVLLRTSYGDLIVALDVPEAPRTREQIARLVERRLYDATRFLRVERGLLVQVGVVESSKKPIRDEDRAAIRPLPLEASPRVRHLRGALSLARDESRAESAESSFAILLAEAPALDGHYTVFGHVARGMEVADAIGEAEVDFGHVPLDAIELKEARLLGPDESPGLAPAIAPRRRPGTAPHVVWFVSVMTLLAAAAALVTAAGRTRMAAALMVLCAFVGVFLVFTLALPLASHSRWLSLLVLAGLVLAFRLVSGFEKKA